MKKIKYEYRIVFRSDVDGLRHTIFAVDQNDLVEKLSSIIGKIQSVERNPDLPRI